MTDFYSLLKQSIIERDIRDANERDEIYSQARRAMIRQLWAFDPPLDEEEIDQRIGAFDVAVSDIEGDVAAAFAANAARRVARRHDDEPEEPRHEPEPVRRRKPEPAREDYGRRTTTRALPAPSSRQRVPERARAEEDEYRERDERRPAYREEPDADPPPSPYEEDDRYDDPPPQRSRGRYPPPAPVEAYEPPPPEPDPYEDEEPPPSPPPNRRRREAIEDGSRRSDESRAITRAERWSTDPRQQRRRPPKDEKKRPPPKGKLSEQTKIRILLGAIGGCLALLVAVGVFILLPKRDDGVTVDIDVRREVSDAATAVRTATQNLPIDQTFMLFDGRDPTVFETSANNPVRFDATGGTVRVGSSPGSPGVRAMIGPGLAARLAGRNIRVTLVARASPDGGAAGMRFAYQSGLAISHWQTANLGANFQAVAITWRVPTQRTDRTGDVLLIEPGVPGDGTGADIKSIRIELLAQ